MIKEIVVILFSTLSMSVTAQANCQICDQNDHLTQSLRILKYSSEADREIGLDKAEETLTQLQKSRRALKAKDSPQKEIAASVLDMVFAAAPYDIESQASQVLYDLISEFRVVREMYEDQTSSKNISCEKRLVKAIVAEVSCNEDVRRKKKLAPKNFEGADACVQVFNYETCLRSSAK